MSNGGSLRINSASSVSKPPFHGSPISNQSSGSSRTLNVRPMTERRAVADREILLAKVNTVPPAALRSQEHRQSRILLRLDRLDRVHDDAHEAREAFVIECLLGS